MAIIVSPPMEFEKALIMEAHHDEPLVFITSDRETQAPDLALISEPYIAYDPASWGGLVGQRYLNKRGLMNTNTVSILDSPEMIVSLVSEAIGVSILPQWKDFSTGHRNIHIFELGTATEKRTISIIYKCDSPRRRKIDVFRSVLHDIQVL